MGTVTPTGDFLRPLPPEKFLHDYIKVLATTKGPFLVLIKEDREISRTWLSGTEAERLHSDER